MAASVFGSRVAADDPASCQVSYSLPHSIVWTGNWSTCDCLNWLVALSLVEMGNSIYMIVWTEVLSSYIWGDAGVRLSPHQGRCRLLPLLPGGL